ncbi:MAG TPA: hypothetical protein VLD18_00010, partial [Verrucomicrobiae bacterium]|nr:hypothetical protein [Verrucomicrobiae bacterium]
SLISRFTLRSITQSGTQASAPEPVGNNMVATKATQPVVSLSGQWTGFTNQGAPAHKRRLDVLLQLRDSHLSGVGEDETGMFVLSGEFDPAAQEFRWVQTYLFGSTVFCRGFCDAGRIWGTWQDAAEGHGGFQIWPLPVSMIEPAPSRAVTTR